MGLTRVLSIASLIVPALSAGAGPRILLPDEAPGPEVRAVSAEFLKRLADGDSAGTKALFAGEAAQAELLDAELRWATSCERFRKTVEEKFGASENTRHFAFADGVRQRADLLPQRVVVVNGDGASVAPVGRNDGGLELHRTDGAWRVTHVELQPRAVQHQTSLYRKMTETADQLGADVRGGRLKDYASVDRAFEEAVRPIMQEPVSDERVAPGVKPGTPVWKPKVDGAGLAGLIGKPVASPEVTAFIDSMPGVPYVSGSEQSLWVTDPAAGAEFGADLSDRGAVRVISVYTGLTPAWGAYGGELPEGLARSDSRRDVERKLGRAPLSSWGGVAPLTAEYPRLGLRVIYPPGRGVRDLDAPVYRVAVEAPDPNGPEAIRGPVDPDKPRLAFRLVAPAGAAREDVDLLTDAGNAGGPVQLAVERRALVDERDVASASFGPAGKDLKELGIYLQMTPAGAAKLKAATARNIGRQLAVVLDGRVLVAPTIRGEVSNAVSIDLGAGVSVEDAHKLAGRLHAAVSQSVEAK